MATGMDVMIAHAQLRSIVARCRAHGMDAMAAYLGLRGSTSTDLAFIDECIDRLWSALQTRQQDSAAIDAMLARAAARKQAERAAWERLATVATAGPILRECER